MRSKVRPRVAPPPPPRRSAPWGMAVIGLILVAAGAVAALAVERLVKNAPGPGTNTAAAPSAMFGPAASPLASAEAIASTAPATSPSPAAPVLEAEMPRAVNGTPLTTESALNATSLGNAPNGRALSAAVTSLGRSIGITRALDPRVPAAGDRPRQVALGRARRVAVGHVTWHHVDERDPVGHAIDQGLLWGRRPRPVRLRPPRQCLHHRDRGPIAGGQRCRGSGWHIAVPFGRVRQAQSTPSEAVRIGHLVPDSVPPRIDGRGSLATLWRVLGGSALESGPTWRDA
jgi:hypothetical protein